MEGVDKPPELKGMVPRAFDQIFEHIAASTSAQFLVRASFLEIYNGPLSHTRDDASLSSTAVTGPVTLLFCPRVLFPVVLSRRRVGSAGGQCLRQSRAARSEGRPRQRCVRQGSEALRRENRAGDQCARNPRAQIAQNRQHYDESRVVEITLFVLHHG